MHPAVGGGGELVDGRNHLSASAGDQVRAQTFITGGGASTGASAMLVMSETALHKLECNIITY